VLHGLHRGDDPRADDAPARGPVLLLARHALQLLAAGRDTDQAFTINYATGSGAVSNLSRRDDQDNPITWTSAGVDTNDPIVSWDAVPGAASYEVHYPHPGKCSP
jgi:hypothetical protein